MKENENSIISRILNEEIYEIRIRGSERKDYNKKTINNVIWSDRLSQDIIYKFFMIFKKELECVTIFMGHKDKFSCISELLYQKFHSEFIAKKDLEESIEEKIKNLGELKFVTSKGLYKKYDDLEDEYEELSFDNIKELFLSLRKNRIEIYKELLKDFKNNKDMYLDFMKNQDYTYT